MIAFTLVTFSQNPVVYLFVCFFVFVFVFVFYQLESIPLHYLNSLGQHLIFGTFKRNLGEKRGDVILREEKQMLDHFSAEKNFL